MDPVIMAFLNRNDVMESGPEFPGRARLVITEELC